MTNTNSLSTIISSIDACVKEVEDALYAFGATFAPVGPEVDDALANIRSILTSGCSPEDYLHPLGVGAFKECYELTERLVVKFCRPNNDTNAEIELALDADDCGLGNIFLPLRVINMPVELPAYIIENESESCQEEMCTWDHSAQTWVENPDYRTPILTHMIIQPRIHEVMSAISTADFPYEKALYEEEPLGTPDNYISFELMRRAGTMNRQWLQSLVRIYGIDLARGFCHFCDDHAVSDLHNQNIGYICHDGETYPVIIDCFSAR